MVGIMFMLLWNSLFLVLWKCNKERPSGPCGNSVQSSESWLWCIHLETSEKGFCFVMLFSSQSQAGPPRAQGQLQLKMQFGKILEAWGRRGSTLLVTSVSQAHWGHRCLDWGPENRAIWSPNAGTVVCGIIEFIFVPQRWCERMWWNNLHESAMYIVNPVQSGCCHGDSIIVSKELQELNIQI